MPRKNQIILSVFMTFFMALIMSGILGYINGGPQFVWHWPQTFFTAWPIAFVVTQFVSPLAFKLMFMVAPLQKA